MPELVGAELVHRFLRELSRSARSPARVYFTGGVTAVLHGWRPSTVDLDLKFVPDHGELFDAIPRLKRELKLNVELACPSDFVPELEGWKDRSIFIAREGELDAFHYDLYSQALSKIERGHDRDRHDVERMLETGLVEPEKLRQLFTEARPRLVRYPSLDEESLVRALDETLAPHEES
ncbi:MAG: DUF6036 family nucleotidyltransferase [Acidobacteriota bacterium]